ncbi:hypothetical protein ACWEGV_39840, partial [Streptomyces sp. NPDC004976]
MRPAAQQRGQGDVVPPPKGLGEGSGGRRGLLLGAHPPHVSAWPRPWGVWSWVGRPHSGYRRATVSQRIRPGGDFVGIESDQVVYEYLSRVGDVAQQRQLPSAARMRLVAELRDEIDRRRARAVVDSPAAVRRIISRIGTPTEVVVAAEDGSGPAPS